MSESGKRESGASGGEEKLDADLRRVPLAEKVLALIAIAILVGFVIHWVHDGWSRDGLFLSAFGTLGFLGALVVATLVILKLFGVRPLAARIEKHAIPIVSLLPIVGFIVSLVGEIPQLLRVGGSMALAYVSAMTYWRKHLPTLGPGAETQPESRADPAASQSAPDEERPTAPDGEEPEAPAEPTSAGP